MLLTLIGFRNSLVELNVSTRRIWSLLRATILLEDKRLATSLRANSVKFLLLSDEMHLRWMLSLSDRKADLLLLLGSEA